MDSFSKIYNIFITEYLCAFLFKNLSEIRLDNGFKDYISIESFYLFTILIAVNSNINAVFTYLFLFKTTICNFFCKKSYFMTKNLEIEIFDSKKFLTFLIIER